MGAAIVSLQSELKNLIAQSRKRNAELAASSETALEKLDALSDRPEDVIWDALRKDSDIMTPFILACTAANAKCCASALQCLQSMAAYHGIAPERLHDLLIALLDATQLGLGIQLKILQLLPVLLHESPELSGTLVVELLQVCAELLGKNKIAVVHNAAYATLQQLITGLFDRIPTGKRDKGSEKLVVSQDVEFEVGPDVYDSAMVLLDMCDIAERTPPRFLKFNDLPLTFTLELLELTLTNQAGVIHRYEEFAAILRLRVTPLLLRLFSEATEFPVVLRVTRVFYLLLRQHLDVVPTESEVILSNLTQVATIGPIWKRALCIEVLQGICAEPDLVLQIYDRYDAQQGRMNVLKSILSDFSEVLARDEDNILPLASSLVIHGNPADEAPPKPVLSRASALSTPVIDMSEKAEPPRVSVDYLYYLVLKCVSSLADGLSKLAPRAASQPEIEGLFAQLGTPLLKCFTVLLGAAMDIELYRLVVRSVQRTGHSAGVLAMHSLRDDYITLLQQFSYLPEDEDSRDQLMPRLILCTRALFNLGYALGNQLGPSWIMIIDVIDRLVVQINGTPTMRNFIGSEDPRYKPIEASLRKLVEATPHLSDEAIVALISSLGKPEEVNYVLIQKISTVNVSRLVDPHAAQCWSTLVELLLGQVNRGDQRASRVLNDISLVVMDATTEDDGEDAGPDGAQSTDNTDREDRAEMQGKIVHAVCGQMKVHGHYEIQVAVVENLNRLLDQYGSKLLRGWERIFEVLARVCDDPRVDLVRVAFHTLELICSDFLDNLPYACVFDLTLCLDQFSRQPADINVSFTSTSLFWAVCDSLMKGANPGIADFVQPVNDEAELVRLARDESSPMKRYALWMLAEIRLAHIASVPQQQVRTGAIQIFLRLFDAHGSKLPLGAWSVAHKLAFSALMEDSVTANGSPVERDETTCLVINGIGKIYVANLARKFLRLPDFGEYWLNLIQYLDHAAKQSAVVALTAYTVLTDILEAANDVQVPMKPIAKFWMAQSPVPSFGAKSPKSASDALAALGTLTPYVLPELDAEETVKALEKVATCAQFPYYHSGGIHSLEPSSLQLSCIRQLDKFNLEKSQILAEYLSILCRFSVLPWFDVDVAEVNPDNNTGKLDPEMYVGLAIWALKRLSGLIESFSSTLKSKEVYVKLPYMLESLSKLISVSRDRELSMQTYLQLLEVSGPTPSEGSGILDGAHQILNGARDSENADIAAMEKYMGIVEQHLETDEWNSIIAEILAHSVIYERSRFTREYWESRKWESDDRTDLEFGSVEPPRPLPRQRVAYYCLGLLQRLSTRNETARVLYDVRTQTVLMQYAGDASLLGAEPMREILRDELLAILQQLVDSQRCSPNIRRILVGCLPYADDDVRLLLRDILSF